MLQADTRAAPRAVAAEAHADHAEAVLAVCLQQPAFRQADGGRVVTALLPVSKRLAALVVRCCTGTLVLQASVDTEAQAVALGAWLTRHGALLAELELGTYCNCSEWQAAAEEAQRDQQQHATAAVLEQLPAGNLRRLVVHSDAHAEIAAQQAAALARALRRQPMQLRSLELAESWRGQAATLLPALRQLRQLTSLVMWVPHKTSLLRWPLHPLAAAPAQVQLPAQLQQLELRGGWSTTRNYLRWLALEHVTGLTSLSMSDLIVDGGVLPRGLHALTVTDIDDAAPVLQLAQLTALQLRWCSASAEQLRQLSTLTRLEQLSVTVDGDYGDMGDAFAAFGALPITHVSTLRQELTAACLDHLGACARLTALELQWFLLVDTTTDQLARMLQRLTALERLELSVSDLSQGDSPGAAPSWVPVCQALARLPRLTVCMLSHADLGPDAAAALAAATQLSELRVVRCGLDDAGMATICSGLTRLRRLGVFLNNALTDGCLACVAAMPCLAEFGVSVDSAAGVTRHGVQQLSMRRPSLRITR